MKPPLAVRTMWFVVLFRLGLAITTFIGIFWLATPARSPNLRAIQEGGIKALGFDPLSYGPREASYAAGQQLFFALPILVLPVLLWFRKLKVFQVLLAIEAIVDFGVGSMRGLFWVGLLAFLSFQPTSAEYFSKSPGQSQDPGAAA